MSNYSKSAPSFLVFSANVGLFFAACLLFALSQPNPLLVKGFAPAGWLCYIPLFTLIARLSLWNAWLWGAAYGALAFNLQGYWLATFHPLAGIIVGAVCLFWFALIFFFTRLALCSTPRAISPLVMTCVWAGFEYLRTLGFAGYPYGLAAYSQWEVIPVIQMASITGVWGVSALLVFPQCVVGLYLAEKKRFPRKSMAAYAVVLAVILAASFAVSSDARYDDAPSAKIALIQQNADPCKDSLAEYRDNLRVLTRLSDTALVEKPDLVVWSETAFVPRIHWYETYRDDADYYALVRSLLDYLAAQDTPFIVGNDDGRKELQPSGIFERVDYNAALLFHKGQIVDMYRKMHLVPFTEYFPYKKQFPAIYAWLLAADTHFWEKGDEFTVFNINGLKFSTPICFEDSFPYLSRGFVQNGAEILVNMSNDAWSASLPGQYQHLSISVFRAVENGRSLVRATASGQTCAVLPNGRVIEEAPPFREAQLTVSVPLMKTAALYTKLGDWFPLFCIILAAASLLTGCVVKIKDRRKSWKM